MRIVSDAYSRKIISGIGVAEYQVGKVDEGVVVDLAREVLAAQPAVREPDCDSLALLCKALLLLRGTAQAQLFDVVERIADLMEHAQRDQQIGVEVRVHVGVQVGAELVFAPYVGLDERFAHVKAVVLRLTHQRFGYRRNVCLAFDRPVGIDVRDLGVGKAQDVDLAVALVHIARHLSADDLQAVLSLAQRQTA